jgi:hypothetical protein
MNILVTMAIERMFLDFVHRLMFLKNTTFRELDLFPSSGKIMAIKKETTHCTIRCVFLRNIRLWTKSKNIILSSALHHFQNPLELIYHDNVRPIN